MPASSRSPWSDSVKPEHRVLRRRRRRRGPGTGPNDDIDAMFTMSPPPRPHRLDRGARAPQHAEEVDLDQQAHLVVGVLPGLLRAQDAGVVDPDLERAALGRGGRHRAVGVRVAHVLGHRPGALAEQLGGLAGGVLVHVGDEHVEAARGEQARDLAPDAASAPGDHRRFHGAKASPACRRQGASAGRVEEWVAPARRRGPARHGTDLQPPQEDTSRHGPPARQRRRPRASGRMPRAAAPAACRASSELEQPALDAIGLGLVGGGLLLGFVLWTGSEGGAVGEALVGRPALPRRRGRLPRAAVRDRRGRRAGGAAAPRVAAAHAHRARSCWCSR